jgi:hypothetical protein
MKCRIQNLYAVDLIYKIAIGVIFLYYFAANFTISGSWDLVALRSVDDVAIQQSIRRIQLATFSGEWKTVFSFVDYAYGFAFWSLNGLLQLPFFLFGSEQLQIIVGRQISLVFVFAGIYFIGKIIEQINEEFGFAGIKYEVLTIVATMPIVAVIGTKTHVNAQTFFFSILSLYLILRKPTLSNKYVFMSAVVAGVAIGMKLTSVLILPIVSLLIFNKLKDQRIVKIVQLQVWHLSVTALVALFSFAPLLFLMPIYKNEYQNIVDTFSLYKGLGGEDRSSLGTRLVEGIGYFVSPTALLVSLVGFIILIFVERKRRSFTVFSVLIGLFVAIAIAAVTVHKGPIYMGNYLISIGFFLPIGILAINHIKIEDPIKKIISGFVVVVLVSSGWNHRNAIMKDYSFFKISNDPRIKDLVIARNEINTQISPISLPTRVLVDCTSVFPLSNFVDGAEIRFLYGDLSNYQSDSWGVFEFISVNIENYYGFVPLDPSKVMTPEQTVRKDLLETGTLMGIKYTKIYENRNVAVFKLKADQ